MKKIAVTALIIGLVSLITGIISRVMITPLTIVPGGLEANAFLAFTNTCFLFAIALTLLGMLNDKK
jgi:Flp pilus assembly pilin Flp